MRGRQCGGQALQLVDAARHQSDPGNRATTKFVCESALALALQPQALPGGEPGGGVLTPASGLGMVLGQRLIAAGMNLEPMRS